jgi:hypothetical protein
MDMVVLLTPTTRRGELIQLGWCAGIGAALVVCGYLALLLIPVVLAADFERSVKAALTGLLGVGWPITPSLVKSGHSRRVRAGQLMTQERTFGGLKLFLPRRWPF